MSDDKSLATMAEEVKRKYTNYLNDDYMEKYFYEEEKRKRPDGPFQRDYSRIMYASSFRRLQGKMQLLGIKADQFFRNRLTHSLEVAQIARSIACLAKYSLAETYVVEAGALAHDIGNPPFGHSGERILHQLYEEIGGFEGNAQTLRILTSVERKRPDFPGLNLTYRTLLSVVKYFNKYKDEEIINKKFIYDEDYNMLYEFINNNNVKLRTFDVQIVDIADEIAYAAHDLEDGLRQKCFTMDEVLHDYRMKYGNSLSYEKLENIVNDCQKKCGYGMSLDSSEYSKMFRQELSSRIIYELIKDLGICDVGEEYVKKTGTSQNQELGFMNYQELATGLKDITFKCINHNDIVFAYEKKGDKIISILAEYYKDNPKHLPPEYRTDKMDQERLTCDYISGMMDSYAITQYERITGESFDKIKISENTNGNQVRK